LASLHSIQKDAVPERSIALIRSKIDLRLGQILPSAQTWPVRLHEAQRHAVLAPGKRFRPLLCILTAEAAGFSGEAAVDVGCVAEIVHAASLILDDLPCMDDAQIRRNQPTTHIEFDESTAILTATALLNRGFGILSRLKHVDAKMRIELVDILSFAVGSKGLIAGQIEDLSNDNDSVSLGEIERLNTLKTGALFDFSVEAAAILADHSASGRAALKDFSYHLGLAFQLLDDVKDSVMSETEAGKTVGLDVGKATILALSGMDMALDRLNGYLENAKAALSRAELRGDTVILRLLDQQFSFMPNK